MTTLVPDRLYLGRPNTTDTVIFTAEKKTAINIIFHNTTNTEARITINVVPSGSSKSLDNQVFNRAIDIEDTNEWKSPIIMNAGDTLVASQQTTGAICLMVNGTIVEE